MNTIPEQQNTQPQLERLAAQRELYSSAKRFHIFQIITTVVLPVIFAVIALVTPSFSVFAALFGAISFICDVALVEPQITKRKNKAAQIKELFDCELLQMPKSPLKIADNIAVEEVLMHYDAHAKIPSNIEKIRDWYSPAVGALPLSVARILCQRTNCWWDSKLRRNYSAFLKYLAVGIFALIIAIGLITDQTLITFTLICGALVPFFQFCIKQHNENIDAASRLDQLVSFSLDIWEHALGGTNDERLLADSRRLQDEIYEHRRRSPLILDYYYNLFRDKDEALMNRGSEILVDEAKHALHIQ